MELALQLGINVLIPASVFVLLIVGFSLIYSITRVMHVAHGAVAIFSGYMFHFFYSVIGMHVAIAVTASIVLATLLGLFLNELVYERLRDQRTVSAAGILIATLSLLLIIQNGMLALFGSGTKTFRSLKGSVYSFGPVLLSRHELLILLLVPVLLLLLWLFLKKTRWGKALRAVADHESVAEVVGISSKKARRLIFGIASVLAGIGGILFVIQYNLEPNMATSVSVRMFYHALVGGIGSVGGAVLGSVLMQGVFVLTGWYLEVTWANMMEFLVLFVVLLARPNGLLGKRKRSI